MRVRGVRNDGTTYVRQADPDSWLACENPERPAVRRKVRYHPSSHNCRGCDIALEAHIHNETDPELRERLVLTKKLQEAERALGRKLDRVPT